MSLDALLARLEARGVTPVMHAIFPDVTLQPLQMQGCTAVTPATAESNMIAIECGLEASDMGDYYEERAAIAEFDGGLPRTLAEAQAMHELTNKSYKYTVH